METVGNHGDYVHQSFSRFAALSRQRADFF
jgi:hypothetical protein